MRMNLSSREKRLLSITAIVLIGVIGYFGVYETLLAKWVELNTEIEALELRLRASQKNYLEEAKIQKEYEEVVSSLRIEGSDTDKQIKIMKELNDLMLEAGVIPKGAKPLNVVEEENFQVFYFSYNDTETNMISLTNFLYLLERRSKVSEIQQIEIKPPSPPLYKPGEQRFKTSFKIARLVYRS